MKNNMFNRANPLIFKRAAELRGQPTHAEDVLWNYLRTKPMGFKFRRQHPYLIYVLDFYCHRLSLAIEVDGSVHQEEDVKLKDKIRQTQLEECGLKFLRFSNDLVCNSLEVVIEQIENFLKQSTKPQKENS